MKKLLSLILAIALLTGISLSVAAESKETTLFKAGTYSAKAFGNNDYIHVEVDVSDSEILRVEVVEHHETKYMADPAIEKIPAQVVAFQTINVDSVTGATVTSAAIRLAVRDALEQACNDISKIQKDIPELEKTMKKRPTILTLSLLVLEVLVCLPQCPQPKTVQPISLFWKRCQALVAIRCAAAVYITAPILSVSHVRTLKIHLKNTMSKPLPVGTMLAIPY